MSDRAAHQSYVGSRAVVSPHGPTSASRSSCRRSGFTLVEVVVAAAILLILLIGLAGMFARGVTGFKQAQLVTMAQNLAEFQVEDLKSFASSKLHDLVIGMDADPLIGLQNRNYPYPTRDTTAEDYDATARANDVFAWMYDSGKLRTDFIVDGVEEIGDISLGFLAGRNAIAIPHVPSETELLLGQNIIVRVYLVDDFNRTFWKDSEADGFYYLDAAGLPVYVAPPVPAPFDPSNELFYYYEIVLQKEAFPLFSRQIRIAEYDVGTPLGSDVWDPDLVSEYRDRQADTRTKYEYEVTIWYRQNGVNRVLFRTSGTIGSPFGYNRAPGGVAS